MRLVKKSVSQTQRERKKSKIKYQKFKRQINIDLKKGVKNPTFSSRVTALSLMNKKEKKKKNTPQPLKKQWLLLRRQNL